MPPAKSPWPGLQVGQLRHFGTIQQTNDATPDSYGQATDSWTVIRTCFAAIDLISAREAALPDLLVSQVSHILTVRWTPVPIAAGMRAIFSHHTYKIQAVENVQQRNILLKLLALEINPTS